MAGNPQGLPGKSVEASELLLIAMGVRVQEVATCTFLGRGGSEGYPHMLGKA